MVFSRLLFDSVTLIVAKETRDDIMDVLDVFYPAYGFARNKGYPTAAHREAVLRFGPSPVHRASFRVKPPSPQIRMELKSEN